MFRGADRSRFGTVDPSCGAHGKVPARLKESEAKNGNPAAVKPARHASDYRRSLWRSRLKPRAILARFDVWPEAGAGPTGSNAVVQSGDGINTQEVIAIAIPCRGLLATQFLRPACPSPLITSSIRRRLPCASVRSSTENRRWVSTVQTVSAVVPRSAVSASGNAFIPRGIGMRDDVFRSGTMRLYVVPDRLFSHPTAAALRGRRFPTPIVGKVRIDEKSALATVPKSRFARPKCCDGWTGQFHGSERRSHARVERHRIRVG